MEHDIIYLKIELSQKRQKYDLVRFYSMRLSSASVTKCVGVKVSVPHGIMDIRPTVSQMHLVL